MLERHRANLNIASRQYLSDCFSHLSLFTLSKFLVRLFEYHSKPDYIRELSDYSFILSNSLLSERKVVSLYILYFSFEKSFHMYCELVKVTPYSLKYSGCGLAYNEKTSYKGYVLSFKR